MLERRTPLARKPLKAKPRSKGGRAEREVIDILRSEGWPSARRSFGSGRDGQGDVEGGPEGFSIEIKHRERCSIWEWIAQAEAEARPTDCPTVVFRRNRCDWYAVVPFDELLALIKFREQAA